MKSKTLLRIGALMLCLMMVLSMFASCGGSDEDTSKATEKTEEDSDDKSKETSEESEASDDASDDATDDASDDASTDTSSTTSSATSEDTSDDTSVYVSEDASVDVSEESSEESEEIPDEYKDLEGVDALEKIEEKIEKDYNGKAAITLSFETEFTAELFETMFGVSAQGHSFEGSLAIEMVKFVDVSGAVNKVEDIMVIGINVVIDGEEIDETVVAADELTIGDKTYVFDHDEKTYFVEEGESSSLVASFFDGTIASHENTTETIDGVEYVADWFTFEDGSAIGLLTLNGELAYIAQSGNDLPFDTCFQIGMSHDVSDATFEIPAGYTEVSLY